LHHEYPLAPPKQYNQGRKNKRSSTTNGHATIIIPSITIGFVPGNIFSGILYLAYKNNATPMARYIVVNKSVSKIKFPYESM